MNQNRSEKPTSIIHKIREYYSTLSQGSNFVVHFFGR